MPQQASALFANQRLEKLARQRRVAQGQLGQPNAASGCRWSNCFTSGVTYLEMYHRHSVVIRSGGSAQT